jgi:hypothetical protein
MSASSDVTAPPELAGAVDGLVEEFTGVFAPQSAPLEVVRAVRNDIAARVRALLSELDAGQVAR